MSKNIKVLISGVLISVVSIVSMGCTKQNLDSKVTDGNLNEVVEDYTQIYNYYENLRVSLIDIDKIRNDKKSSKDIKQLQKDIDTNLDKVKKLEYNYINLYDAQGYLEKCYKYVKKASENAGTNDEAYDKYIIKFKEDFAEFKQSMALSRKDIAAIRGGAIDTESSELPSEDAATNSSGSIMDEMVENTKDRITSVALSQDLKNAIEENAYLSGQEYKANGGTEANIEKEAKQLFSEIENDNPIDENQKDAAEKAYVEAFKKGFNEYKK